MPTNEYPPQLQPSVVGAPSNSEAPSPRTPMSEKEISDIWVTPPPQLNGPIQLDAYSADWPRLFAREAARIQATLGANAIQIEHVGSTSVPGLAAKPIIDMLLIVPDSADEAGYIPALEAVGYRLVIREPDWYEHRVFKGPDTNINLHTFSPQCAEVERMLRFRDWLRTHPADRDLYERTKRALAQQEWKYIQNYADAKSTVVAEILARATGEKAPE